MSATASTLRCPSCGAPAERGASRCDYCRSRLATVACPACFELLFDGATFCPHCGAARSRTESTEAAAVRCPACRGAMAWVKVGAVDLLECTECDGTWIEAAQFERLCADRDGQSAMAQHVQPARPAAAAQTRIMYRPCPRCGKLMNRVNFGRLSGTIVDVCRGHGTFLDRGELHAVVSFILDGGLDRARQAERDALVEEQRRLRELEAMPPGKIMASGSRWDEGRLLDFLTALTRRD